MKVLLRSLVLGAGSFLTLEIAEILILHKVCATENARVRPSVQICSCRVVICVIYWLQGQILLDWLSKMSQLMFSRNAICFRGIWCLSVHEIAVVCLGLRSQSLSFLAVSIRRPPSHRDQI